MQLFYSKDITPNGFCTLDAEESRHAVRVLRMREGDTIHVTDGRGNLYQCTIINASDKSCVVSDAIVISLPFTPSNSLSLPQIHLAVAPTKNPARMEWLVEKAVEIGVGGEAGRQRYETEPAYRAAYHQPSGKALRVALSSIQAIRHSGT